MLFGIHNFPRSRYDSRMSRTSVSEGPWGKDAESIGTLLSTRSHYVFASCRKYSDEELVLYTELILLLEISLDSSERSCSQDVGPEGRPLSYQILKSLIV